MEGKSELQSLLHSIPYKRLLLWGFVGAVGWQLHEFFGVSFWHAGPGLLVWALLGWVGCSSTGVQLVRQDTAVWVIAAAPVDACAVCKCIG
jgi:hypothetical protein